ncbi:MAG: hypothetical protein WCB19_06780, partial [Thermoplasmata archaeon]
MGHRGKRILIGTGFVVALILGATLGYGYLPVGTTCALGNRVGTYNVTAPEMIANYPDSGGAGVNESAQNWTFSSGAVVLGNTVHSSGGFGMWSAGGGGGLLLQTDQPNFAVYSVHNVSSPLPSGSHPCTQPYVTETVSNGYCGGGGGYAGYPLPDPSNDSVEPHIFNASCSLIPNGSGIVSGAYMWIDNTFPKNPPPGTVQTLNLCSWTTNFSQIVRGVVALPIILYAPYDGRTLSIQGYLWWASVFTNVPTASYSLPPGAIWRVATVGIYSED